ncbi:MAG: EAL domain-containing response regulator [Planctomycetota bacterium]|jgi:EAL domain-containing protein (putative c-di-GMP-specific phosphodiesterase class I)/ActR/RegA family two-component response regulator|nr:EAL domain-containing response regulator [Planctomycetota bacterium]MDP6990507.1 EAL domain-containing response regulator [Planctomycetota bacterium]
MSARSSPSERLSRECGGLAPLLIVDDDPRICRLIGKVAEEMGLRSEALSEPEDLLHLDASGREGLVLLDLGMPGLDGVEVLRRFAAARCRACICLISGTAEEVLASAKRLGIELGLDMAEPLSKPLDLRTLQDLLKPLQATGFHRCPTIVDLARAIEKGEVVPHYQPKISLETGKSVGYEVLARWSSEEFGDVPPAIFVPMAEEGKLMEVLTGALARRALEEIGERCKGAGICINLSPSLLEDLCYPDLMEGWACDAGVFPSRVTLEITESEAMRDPKRYMDILIRFRLKGFHLSIDDFGTGFSSLDHLYRLPFEELKVDRTFIRDLCDREEARVIVGTMIALSRGLGMTSVAEGVEDTQTAELLRGMGCVLAQGHLFSPALDARSLRRWEGLGEQSVAEEHLEGRHTAEHAGELNRARPA